jgi:glycosyltransferase involved in cell wall biosynthesis
MPEKEMVTAVMIPCHNEAAAIGKVIDDFRAMLPQATLYVFDNCCTDNTAAIAQRHGAIVVKEPRKGKGYVVEAMFNNIRADYFVLVDGDDTYPAEKVGELLGPVVAGDADMVVGSRLAQHGSGSFSRLHKAGNRLVRWLINCIFGTQLTDILSGYRVFNKRFAQSVPVVSLGFEVETELTINALYYRLKVVEVQVPYRERAEGSQSKIRTFRDGLRLLWKIGTLFRAYKPLTFFGGLAILLLVLGLLAGILPVYEYFTFRYVYRVPLAVLASSLVIVSIITATLGVFLHTLNWRFRELHNVLIRRNR